MYHSRKYPTPFAMFYFYKNLVRPKMECCSPILTLAMTEFNSICMDLWLMNCFPHQNPFPTNEMLVASCLLYHYFNGRYLNELCSLILPVQVLTARTCQAAYTELIPPPPPHPFHVTLVRRKLHSELPRTVAFWSIPKRIVFQ